MAVLKLVTASERNKVLLYQSACLISLVFDLPKIRRCLTKAVAVTVANSLVSIRYDYCNSLFCSFSENNLIKLH